MKETSPENESPSPRTREASAPPLDGLRLLGGGPAQLKEDRTEGAEESDPGIVVRDGRTDHMAKDRAGKHRSQSTHAKGTKVPMKSVSSTLAVLNRKAEQKPEYRFRDLNQLMNLQALYESFHSLRKNAAPGVDGVTYEDYESNLDENLRDVIGSSQRQALPGAPREAMLHPEGERETAPPRTSNSGRQNSATCRQSNIGKHLRSRL